MGPRELISKRTRNEFREFFVGWTLREIETEFSSADLEPDRSWNPQIGGQRRVLVEQYYHAIDFTKPSDVRRLIAVYESVLCHSLAQQQAGDQGSRAARDLLVNCLKQDGYRFQDGKIGSALPETRVVFDDEPSGRSISELTRRNIFDALQIAKIPWYGRLTEPEFLARLYDLEGLPSDDSRFGSAARDIIQHRVLNDDWASDWLFTDSRFNLMKTSDEAFLRFLCEMVHPVVRADAQDVYVLIQLFNEHLEADGWELVPRTQLSGRPVFAGRRRMLAGPALGGVKSLVQTLGAEYVTQQITRLEAAIEPDPELAIGQAKEFVETCCKTILDACGESGYERLKLSPLVKQTLQHLQLMPANIPDGAKGAEHIKALLGNLAAMSQQMAELRNLYGTGHGKHAKHKRLPARHARLAVGAASTLALFLFETHTARTAEARPVRTDAS